MRSAYALLGLAFLIVFITAYLLIERAQDTEEVSETSTETVNN